MILRGLDFVDECRRLNALRQRAYRQLELRREPPKGSSQLSGGSTTGGQAWAPRSAKTSTQASRSPARSAGSSRIRRRSARSRNRSLASSSPFGGWVIPSIFAPSGSATRDRVVLAACRRASTSVVSPSPWESQPEPCFCPALGTQTPLGTAPSR